MKIALPTNDRKNLAKRTGRAEEFAIYDIKNSKIVTITYFSNTHEHHDHSHGEEEHNHSHKEITDLISDVDLLIVSKIGVHMKQDIESANINYKVVTENDIDTILKEYL